MTDSLTLDQQLQRAHADSLLPPRRHRRDRLYPAAHWRARLASWLRSVADRLNPLADAMLAAREVPRG